MLAPRQELGELASRCAQCGASADGRAEKQGASNDPSAIGALGVAVNSIQRQLCLGCGWRTTLAYLAVGVLREPSYLACCDIMHRGGDLHLSRVDERLDDRTALGQARSRQA